MNRTHDNLVIAASRLAQRLHSGQVDKAGIDYYSGHLSFVASLGNDWDEKVVGYLHDANEDTPYTVEQILSLLEEEAGENIALHDREELATAMLLLDHHGAESREKYIQLISSNRLATVVKLNDLTHNMDLSRLSQPSGKDYERLERYKREFDFLQGKHDHR